MWQINTAIVHDRYITKGGAERVVDSLIHQYKTDNWNKVKLYVLMSPYSTINEVCVVSVIPQRLFRIISKVFDYRNTMPLYPVLVGLLSIRLAWDRPERLLVSSFAAVKNVRIPSSVVESTLYLHSSMQYIRELYDQYSNQLWSFKRVVFRFVSWYMRKWDVAATPKYSQVTANSTYTAKIATKRYGFSHVTVSYPPLHTVFVNSLWVSVPSKDYYIFVWRVVKFVRHIDKVIELANSCSIPLVIVWDWPDMDYAKSIAWPTVIFKWRVESPEEKYDLIRYASWLINLANESAWIVTMECLSCGVPVFGFKGGWTQELLWQIEDTWVVWWTLVNQLDHESLCAWFEQFHQNEFDRASIADAYAAAIYPNVGWII